MGISQETPFALALIIVSFVVTSIFMLPFINFLYRLKLTKKRQSAIHKNKASDGQKIFDELHDSKAGTPIGGGLLVIACVLFLFIGTLVFLTTGNHEAVSAYPLLPELFVILSTFILFGLIGMFDDLIKMLGAPKKSLLAATLGLSTKQKLLSQIVFGALISGIMHFSLGIDSIYIPVVNTSLYLGLVYVPFATLLIVFFSNAFNITDGLDGLSSGLLIIYLFAYVIIASNNLDSLLFLFISVWIGSLISFLYFNINPARIFLGDSGSLSFGATIAVIGLLIGNIAVLFVVGALFAFDALSSLLQIASWRIRKKTATSNCSISPHFTINRLGRAKDCNESLACGHNPWDSWPLVVHLVSATLI